MKYFQNYKDALEKAGFTVTDAGEVINADGTTVAGEDRFGNAYCKDPNVFDICRIEEERRLAAPAKPAPKKKAPSKTKVKKVRARNEDGTLKADDPSTPDVNEAWTYVEVTPGDDD